MALRRLRLTSNGGRAHHQPFNRLTFNRLSPQHERRRTYWFVTRAWEISCLFPYVFQKSIVDWTEHTVSSQVADAGAQAILVVESESRQRAFCGFETGFEFEVGYCLALRLSQPDFVERIARLLRQNRLARPRSA